MKKILFTLSQVVITLGIFSQTGIVNIQPKEVLEKAYETYYDADYEETIKQVDQININDSVYGDALNLKASAYLKLKNFAKTIEICNYAISINKGNKLFFLTNKGVAYLRDEKHSDALNAFTEILKDYPYNSTTYYNIGLCYYNLGDYKKAIEYIQTSIVYNPYYAEPHYELGLICLHENLVSQALLCFDTYLLLDPESERSLEVLVLANNMVSSKQKTEPKNIAVSPDDEGFQEFDLILNNYAALNAKYKITNKITLPFVKQNHALMEKLSQFEGANGFWQKNYVQFYSELFKAGYFDALIYRLLSSTTNEEYSKIVKKANSKDDTFVSYAANSWTDIVGKNNIPAEIGNNKQFFYYSSGQLNAIGRNNELNEYDGPFLFYTKEGRLKSHGDMKKDNYEGYWKFYHENGFLATEGNYINDKAEGLHSDYRLNGNIENKSNYTEGKNNGDYFEYNNNGVLSAKYIYADDILNGSATFYHKLGENYKHYDLTYKNNQIDGPVTEYYPSGEKQMDATFLNNQRHGLETIYYRSGQIQSKTNYVNGEPDGDFISYFQNGKVHLEGKYLNGEYSGNWKVYFDNGVLGEEINYSENGKLEGEYREFDTDGKLISLFIYKNDDIKQYSFYDKSGNIIESKTKSKGKNLDYKGFFANGNVQSEGKFLPEGGRIGEWKFYDKYGCLDSKESYENKKIAKDEEFYANGALNSLTFYVDGIKDGYSFSNYIDGTKIAEGYYSKGSKSRIWRNYYVNGTISGEFYYTDDEFDGYQYNYAVDGKLYSTNYYEGGSLLSTSYFDTTGQENAKLEYFKSNNQKLFYPNGKLLHDIEYLNGIAHGKAIWYYPNGKTQTIGNYFNGERNGEWLWYFDNGQLATRVNYAHGLAEGTWFNYHENGKPRTIRNFINDKIVGEYKSFNEDGILTYSAKYFDGELIDTAFSYSETGELQLARIYNNGELLSYSYEGPDGKLLPFIALKNGSGELVTYYKNGQKSRQMTLLAGENNGNFYKYHPNGQLADESYYVNGALFKPSIEYFSNGKIKIQSNYLNDELNGEYLSYYSNGQLKEKSRFLNGKHHGVAEFYNEKGKLIKRIYFYNDEIRGAEYF